MNDKDRKMYVYKGGIGLEKIIKDTRNKIINDILKKLGSLEYVDLRQNKSDFPELWIKPYEVQEIIKYLEKML